MVPDRLVLDTEMKKKMRLLSEIWVCCPCGNGDLIRWNTTGSIQAGRFAGSAGDADSRLQFTKNFLTMLARNIIFHNVEAVIIDDRRAALSAFAEAGFVKNINLVSEGMAYVDDYCYNLDGRRKWKTDLQKF